MFSPCNWHHRVETIVCALVSVPATAGLTHAEIPTRNPTPLEPIRSEQRSCAEAWNKNSGVGGLSARRGTGGSATAPAPGFQHVAKDTDNPWRTVSHSLAEPPRALGTEGRWVQTRLRQRFSLRKFTGATSPVPLVRLGEVKLVSAFAPSRPFTSPKPPAAVTGRRER